MVVAQRATEAARRAMAAAPVVVVERREKAAEIEVEAVVLMDEDCLVAWLEALAARAARGCSTLHPGGM